MVITAPSSNEHNEQEQLPIPHQAPLPVPPPTAAADDAPIVNDSSTNSVDNSLNTASLQQLPPGPAESLQPTPGLTEPIQLTPGPAEPMQPTSGPEPLQPTPGPAEPSLPLQQQKQQQQEPPAEISVNTLDPPQVSLPPPPPPSQPLPPAPHPPTANSVLPPASSSLPPTPLPPPQAPIVPPGQSQGNGVVVDNAVNECSEAEPVTAMDTAQARYVNKPHLSMFDVETIRPLCECMCVCMCASFSRRVSPPSLHANEEMLSEDSEEEEMDARDTPIIINNRKTTCCNWLALSLAHASVGKFALYNCTCTCTYLVGVIYMLCCAVCSAVTLS